MVIQAAGIQGNGFNLKEIQGKIVFPVFHESYTEFPNTKMLRRQEISDSGYLKAFLVQVSNDPLREEVAKSRWNTLNIENLTHGRIVVPHQELLIEKANYYRAKYGISILVVERDSLSSAVNLIKESLTEPAYIGIIVCYGHLAANHATPVLIYLNPLEYDHDEYLILDSTGNDHHLMAQLQTITNSNNVYSSVEIRQADARSCRTDAIILLRNALLSLKFHERKNGFKEALQAAVVIENRIEHLPPEWDYTAQISNKQNSASGTRVLRNIYSKDPVKQEKIEFIGAFRIRNSTFTSFSCLLTSGARKLTDGELKKWQAIPILDASTKLKVDDLGPIVEFRVTRFVNTYLVIKSLNWLK